MTLPSQSDNGGYDPLRDQMSLTTTRTNACPLSVRARPTTVRSHGRGAVLLGQGDTMRRKCSLLVSTVALLGAALLVPAVALAATTAGAATSTATVTYAYTGTSSTTCTVDGGICTTSMAGTASTCTGSGCPTAPASGDVSLNLQYPPSPCKGGGSKQHPPSPIHVAWSDTTTSDATVSGHLTGHRLTLTGTVSTGTFAGQTVTIPVTFVHPPSPCKLTSSPFTGSLAFG
jgi:hypothetical protein